MNLKEKRLAAQLLQLASDNFGHHNCNDWEFPVDWTIAERTEFCRAYHAWNGDPQDFNPNHLHLLDFAVMAYLASALYCETQHTAEPTATGNAMTVKEIMRKIAT